MSTMEQMQGIANDMRSVFDKVLSGEIDRKIASELANISGKGLKAHQLMLAREIFEDSVKQRIK